MEKENLYTLLGADIANALGVQDVLLFLGCSEYSTILHSKTLGVNKTIGDALKRAKGEQSNFILYKTMLPEPVENGEKPAFWMYSSNGNGTITYPTTPIRAIEVPVVFGNVVDPNKNPSDLTAKSVTEILKTKYIPESHANKMIEKYNAKNISVSGKLEGINHTSLN